jgi:hypothetical protein
LARKRGHGTVHGLFLKDANFRRSREAEGYDEESIQLVDKNEIPEFINRKLEGANLDYTGDGRRSWAERAAFEGPRYRNVEDPTSLDRRVASIHDITTSTEKVVLQLLATSSSASGGANPAGSSGSGGANPAASSSSGGANPAGPASSSATKGKSKGWAQGWQGQSWDEPPWRQQPWWSGSSWSGGGWWSSGR